MTPAPAGPLAEPDREELLRLLASLAHDMGSAVIDPPTVSRDDWLGPASEACRRLETELRGRLVQVLGELDRLFAALRSVP